MTVRAVNEGPEVSGTATYTMSENQDLTGASFTARDPEEPDAEVTSWRLSGSDAGDFTIADTSQQTGQNTAELTFRNLPDYDRPADSNRDNEYVLTIRAYNGGTYGSLDVTVTVTDQNEGESGGLRPGQPEDLRKLRSDPSHLPGPGHGPGTPASHGRCAVRMAARLRSATAAP